MSARSSSSARSTRSGTSRRIPIRAHFLPRCRPRIRIAAPRRRRSRATRPIRSIRPRAAASTPVARLRSRSAQMRHQNSPRSIEWATRPRATWRSRVPAIAARPRRKPYDETDDKRDQGDGTGRRRSRRRRDRDAHLQFHRTGLRGLCGHCRHAAVRSRARALSDRADCEGLEMSTEPALMTLTEVARAIAMKQVSSHEVTRALLHRIAQWQPHLNAFMSIESEAALKAADAADAELAKGEVRGPLHGVPLAHKDMYYDAGHVATCGSLIRRDFVPTVTSTALQRLKDAGQVRLGTLHLAEFAYGPTGHNAHYGPVRNPWNVAHITGGSSSGSGSAVAARLTYAALGSDTGGSIRMPAHFCGVTGLKTTVGRVSRAGAMPLSQSLDTVGPLARTAEDCALLLALMAGPDPEDSTASREPLSDYVGATKGSLKGLKVGVPSSFYVDDLDGEVARVLDETIAVLKREGADIVTVELPEQRQLTAACQFVLAVEAAAFHKRWLIERPQDYGAQVLMRLQNGLAMPAVSYLEAMRWRGPALAAHLAATAGVDAVLAPVAPAAAPTIAESDVGNSPDAEAMIQRLTRFTRPVNYLGLPSLAIPAGFTGTGLPVGMQLIGRPFVEATLLRAGAAFQRATDFHARSPEMEMA